jgi:transposase-like protein
VIDERLLPCPFCGGTEFRIDPSLYWTGMKNTVLSVTVRHWCKEDILRSTINMVGKTEEEAVEKWNSRVGAYS